MAAEAIEYPISKHDGTGLYFYRARYYSPMVHRFLSEDPIGLEGGDENFYAYTFNSPTNFTDPSGLFIAPGASPPGCSGSTAGRKPLDDFIQELDCASNFLPGGGAIGQVGKVGAKAAASAAAKASQKLKNVIANINKGKSNTQKIGDGTTMDAIRNELRTGELTHGSDHVEKGLNSIKSLQKLLNQGNLSAQEQGVAQQYIDALVNALSGK